MLLYVARETNPLLNGLVEPNKNNAGLIYKQYHYWNGFQRWNKLIRLETESLFTTNVRCLLFPAAFFCCFLIWIPCHCIFNSH